MLCYSYSHVTGKQAHYFEHRCPSGPAGGTRPKVIGVIQIGRFHPLVNIKSLKSPNFVLIHPLHFEICHSEPNFWQTSRMYFPLSQSKCKPLVFSFPRVSAPAQTFELKGDQKFSPKFKAHKLRPQFPRDPFWDVFVAVDLVWDCLAVEISFLYIV